MAQAPPQAAVAHLHNDLELTHRLLAEPTRWRERVVEKLVIEDADDVAVTSSYQVRLPLDLVRSSLPSAQPGTLVRLLLPLTRRHKAVLLDVDLAGVGGHHCALLLKHQLARLQANYMAWAARPAAHDGAPLVDAEEMLYAISAYSPAAWDVLRAESLGRRSRLLAEYLSLGLGFPVSAGQVSRWSELVESAAALLSDALSQREWADRRSAATHPLRCLPFSSRRPAHPEMVTEWLERFVRLVHDADAASRSLIAGYGQHWDVVIDTVIPVDVPTKIQLRTKRPWHDGAVPRRPLWLPMGTVTQRVMLGDAQSGHAEVHVADHDVRILRPPQVADPLRKRVGIPRMSALRWTDDKASIYLAGEDAPAFVDLRLKLGLRRPTRSFLWLLILACGASLPLAAAVEGSDLLGRSTALFVLPLASAILLARPATGVAQRLQRRLRGTLIAVVAAVAAVVAVRLAVHTLVPAVDPEAATQISGGARPPRVTGGA